MVCRQQVLALFGLACVTQSTFVYYLQPHVFYLLQQAPCHHMSENIQMSF